MFAYKGTDAYRNDAMIPGTHLYEGTTRDPRDWRKLFDITPYSCRSDLLITDELRHRAELVEEATRMGIREIQDLSCTFCQFIINLHDPHMIADFTAKSAKILQDKDANQAKLLLENMKKHPLKLSEQKVMLTNARTPELADSMNRDILIASPVWCELLSRQIQLIKQYNRIQNQLAELVRTGKPSALT